MTLAVRHNRPAQTTNAPGIIVMPGGIATGSLDSIDWAASRLARAGFHVLSVTYRSGSPEHDPRDVRIALEWFSEREGVDGNRIAVFGMSRGGMSALRTAALVPELRAAVSFGSPTDLLQHVRGVAPYAPGRYQLLCDWLGGAPDENRAFYEMIQPISYASQIRQPVLGIHGQFDMHVPPEQTIWMNEALRRHGNEQAEVHLIPFMNHYADVTPTYQFGFDLVMEPACEFFKRVLETAPA
ncbi:alpha/beta hydrolase family protein [Paraburkholderia pallida]|uniref:Peptidase S15 n=1 Tax=Paraburkholderia pallida TaxID=2547399 RepID=A0A4P7D692_9BURK|nr:prolyl oligopeptidase family serine peptidase [Paraburkholderia pallida]QBR03648.1 peptidase S15 [Paraburkholderia pallida]